MTARAGRERRVPRALVALGAALLVVVLAMPVAAQPTVETDTQRIEVTVPSPRPTLRWGLNIEANGGAFFGDCNFLSAGVAGDTARSRLWTEQDGFYRAEAGNVRIEKPNARGAYVRASWATRCLDRQGRPVSSASTSSSTEAQVVIRDGRWERDPRTGVTTIAWEGSFTVAFYGGLTYWSASDPVLRLYADGTGQLTALASGFGADRDDPTSWAPLAPTEIVLADLSGVEVGPHGFAVVPDYLGVAVDVTGAAPQAPRDATNESYWGSFPASFVAFQAQTGQSSFWYTSNGLRDRAKPPVLLEVLYGPSARPATPAGPGTSPGPDTGSLSPGPGPGPGPTTPPGGGGPSGGPAGSRSRATASGSGAGDEGEHDEVWPLGALAETVFGAGIGELVPTVVAPRGGLSTERLLASAGVLGAGSVLLALRRRGWLVLGRRT